MCMRSFSSAERMTLQSEGSSLAHSLSLGVQEPTECCEYISQHGHCVVDTTTLWNIETDVYRSQWGQLPVQKQIIDAEIRPAENVKQTTETKFEQVSFVH